MNFPFGKFKGKPVEDAPTEYLQWFAENINGQDALVREVENQLQMREGQGVSRGKR